MNVLQHTRNERNPCLKQNRPDRSYRDTLLNLDKELANVSSEGVYSNPWNVFLGYILLHEKNSCPIQKL